MERNLTAVVYSRISSKFIPDDIVTALILLWPSILLIICPLGLWANALVIRTFLRMGLKDSITISFFSLGLSDFAHVLCPVLSIALYVMDFMEAKFDFFFRVQGLLLYIYVSNLASMFNNLTMYITTFLAVQRCLCVVKALYFKDMFTKRRTWFIMGCFSLLSSVSTIAFYASFGSKKTMNTYTNISQYVLTTTSWYKYTANYIGTTTFTILPFISQGLVVGSVVVMRHGLKASLRFRKGVSAVNAFQSNTTSGSKSENKNPERDDGERQNSKEEIAIIQVVFLSTIFLLTNLPKTVIAATALIIPGLAFGKVYENLFRVLVGIRLSCDYLNSAVNFFIYYKYNSSFRKLCFAPKNNIVKETLY